MTPDNKDPTYVDFEITFWFQIACIAVASISLSVALSILAGKFSVW